MLHVKTGFTKRQYMIIYIGQSKYIRSKNLDYYLRLRPKKLYFWMIFLKRFHFFCSSWCNQQAILLLIFVWRLTRYSTKDLDLQLIQQVKKTKTKTKMRNVFQIAVLEIVNLNPFSLLPDVIISRKKNGHYQF